jgi:hypothetical protein
MEKRLKRWLRALELAKIIFEQEGYHIKFLEEIEEFLKMPENRTKLSQPP